MTTFAATVIVVGLCGGVYGFCRQWKKEFPKK